MSLRTKLTSIVIALVTLLPACSGHHSATAGAAPNVPSAPLAVMLETRQYTAGPGADILTVHRDAGAVIANHTSTACVSSEQSLGRLGSLEAVAGKIGGLPDTQLAELAADEMASLASVLGACLRGPVAQAVLQELTLARDTVDQRLRADGIKP